jgi:hypothetical protein
VWFSGEDLVQVQQQDFLSWESHPAGGNAWFYGEFVVTEPFSGDTLYPTSIYFLEPPTSQWPGTVSDWLNVAIYYHREFPTQRLIGQVRLEFTSVNEVTHNPPPPPPPGPITIVEDGTFQSIRDLVPLPSNLDIFVRSDVSDAPPPIPEPLTMLGVFLGVGAVAGRCAYLRKRQLG